MSGIIIVGANMAGISAAQTLRAKGHAGDIMLIDSDPRLPYERPPLSKQALSEEAGDTLIVPERFYAENAITLHLGTTVAAIDADRRTVRTSDGADVGYNMLLLSTGGRPRRLHVEGATFDGVHVLRDRSDADALLQSLSTARRLAVIGFGVIGAEVAASARSMGLDVIGIEAAPLPMARTFGSRFGRWLHDHHVTQGVEMRLGAGVARLIGTDDRLSAIELTTGERIAADAAIIGIGIDPCDELARAAGIACDNGIVVDDRGRTSIAGIFAAGDVARRPDFDGLLARIETFQGAAESGTAAACGMLGLEPPASAPCWFWSNQYALSVQTCGRVQDELAVVVRGDLAGDSFIALFSDGEVIVGALAINRPQDFAAARRLIAARSAPSAALGDEAIPLRSFLARPSAKAA